MIEFFAGIMKTRQLLIGGIVVFLFLGGFFALTPGVAATDSPDAERATISDQLESQTGEQTVVVKLTERSEQAIRSTAAGDQETAMRSHANASQEELLQFAHNSPHIEVETELWITNAVVLTVDTEQVPLTHIAAIENVKHIHENYKLTTAANGAAYQAPSGPASTTEPPSPASAPSASTQATADPTPTRAIDRIGAPDVWETYTRGEGVRVAVIDTGVNPDHPDIDIEDENWACFADCDNNPAGPHDVDGHGTHVSGTVIGGSANDAGLQIGIAPEATLLHAKALGDDGAGNFAAFAESVQWAVENDADVVTASLGAEGKSQTDIDLVRNTQAAGVMFIASVGNAGPDTSSSPANVYDATAVGSTDLEPDFPDGWNYGLEDDAVSSFSGGETIDRDDWDDAPADWPSVYIVPNVVAPGSIIWSADTDHTTTTDCGATPPTTDLSCLSGTSMATPHVAGVVALMQASTESSLSPTTIQSTLESTAVDIDDDETRQGSGLVDGFAAVEAVADEPPENGDEPVIGVDTNRNFDDKFAIDDADVYQGQIIGVGGFKEGEEVLLRENVDDDTNHTRATTIANENGFAIFDTENRDEGDYFLQNAGEPGGEFEILVQTLDADFDDDEVEDEGPGAQTEIEFDSEIRITYDIIVNAEGDLDEDDLADIFDQDDGLNVFKGEGNLTALEADDLDDDYDLDPDEAIVLRDVVDDDYDLDFDGIDESDYDFNFDVADTTAGDSDSITVEPPANGPVEEDTVAPGGSTITINVADGASAVAVGNFTPDDVELSDFSDGGQEQPGGAIWNSPQDDTVSFTLTPGDSIGPGDEITFNVDPGDGTVEHTVIVEDDDPEADPPADGPVEEDTVAPGGSTITINVADGASAVAVENFNPDDVELSDFSGVGQPQPGGAIWNGPQEDTVSFTLTPGDSIEPGDTITFDVFDGDETTTHTVTVLNIPAGFPGTADQFTAIDQDGDGELGSIELAQAITENAEEGSVNGVQITPIEFAKIIDWNADQ